MKHIKNLTLVDDDDVFVFLTKKTEVVELSVRSN